MVCANLISSIATTFANNFKQHVRLENAAAANASSFFPRVVAPPRSPHAMRFSDADAQSRSANDAVASSHSATCACEPEAPIVHLVAAAARSNDCFSGKEQR